MIKWEKVEDKFRYHPNADIILPTRATKHSAGFDIYLPEDIEIFQGMTYTTKLDIKCKFDDDTVMLIVPRSSIGFKHGIMLVNTVGVIDSDFYNNAENGGNIGLSLYKFGSGVTKLKAGDRIAQAIFVKYETDGIEVNTVRSGGIGSTDK